MYFVTTTPVAVATATATATAADATATEVNATPTMTAEEHTPSVDEDMAEEDVDDGTDDFGFDAAEEEELRMQVRQFALAVGSPLTDHAEIIQLADRATASAMTVEAEDGQPRESEAPLDPREETAIEKVAMALSLAKSAVRQSRRTRRRPSKLST